jgi:hypothetical protein
MLHLVQILASNLSISSRWSNTPLFSIIWIDVFVEYLVLSTYIVLKPSICISASPNINLPAILVFYCTYLYSIVHSCILLYIHTYILLYILAFFCTSLSSFVHTCILLYILIYYCTYLYSIVHPCILLHVMYLPGICQQKASWLLATMIHRLLNSEIRVGMYVVDCGVCRIS